MKIRSLTEEQSDMLEEYAKRAVAQGLCCDPIDKAAARDYGRRVMKWLGRECLGTIILDSPFAASIAAQMLTGFGTSAVWENGGDAAEQIWPQVLKQVGRVIPDPTPFELSAHGHRYLYPPGLPYRREKKRDRILRSRCMELVWDQVIARCHRDSAGRQLVELVEEEVAKIIYTRFSSEVARHVVTQGRNQIREEVAMQTGWLWPYLGGQWSSCGIAMEQYLLKGLNLDVYNDGGPREEQVQFGGVYPLAKYVIISKRPEYIRKNPEGRLHCADGPAVRYADGFSVYALNGARVPESLVLNGRDEIDPGEFMNIQDSDARREFIRKVGRENVIRVCGPRYLQEAGVQRDLLTSFLPHQYSLSLNPLDKKEEAECLRAFATAKDEDARYRLLEAYVPLAQDLAKQFDRRFPGWFDMQDCISYAYFGLMDAIRKFSPDGSLKFSCYCMSRILDALADALRRLCMNGE